MKFCKDCDFSKKEFIAHNGKAHSMYFCTNMECREPVSGDMLPCEIVRKEQVFCGIQAKHFKQKEEQVSTEKVVELIKS